MAAQKRSPRSPGVWQNFVIITFLTLISIDSFPGESKVAVGLRRMTDPVMDKIGIWQEPWGLYAPLVDRENNWVEARVYIEGQDDPVLWRSPHWKSLNCFEKFTKSRDIEFYDRIRSKGNEPAWESYAQYLVRDYNKIMPDDTVKKIELISAAVQTPPPEQVETKPETKRLRFYTLDFD